MGLVVLAAVLVGLWLWARRRTDPGPVVRAAGVAMLVSVVLAPIAFPWYALTGLAILAYGGVADRWRYRVALLVAPLGLPILPNGNGLAALIKEPAVLFDGALVTVVAVPGARQLPRRRPEPAAHRPTSRP